MPPLPPAARSKFAIKSLETVIASLSCLVREGVRSALRHLSVSLLSASTSAARKINTMSRIIHPHANKYILCNGHTVFLSRFKGKNDISLDIHIVMLLKSLFVSQLSNMVIQNPELLN